MKKIIITVVIALSIFLIPLNVMADMSAPMIIGYSAVVSNVEGANYYGYDENIIGKLEYGTEINVNYEDPTYAHFNFGEEAWSNSYYIKLNDIMAFEDNTPEINEIDLERPKNIKVLVAEGLPIYKGPAYAYGTFETKIPKGVDLVGYYLKNYGSESPWLYITYNGVSGWICELNGSVGAKPEQDSSIMTAVQIELKGENESIIIPANTIIDNYLTLDMWSFAYYVTYNDVSGYISSSDCAWKAREPYNAWDISFSGMKMYEEASRDSEVLINSIPAGVTLTYDYETEIRADGYIHTTYEDKTGWVHVFDDYEWFKEMYPENNEIIKPSENTESSGNTENIIPSGEEIGLSSGENNNSENIIVPELPEDNKGYNDIPENSSGIPMKMSGMQIVIICVSVAFISFVTILLVNKKNKK